jgi:hypothetical protein
MQLLKGFQPATILPCHPQPAFPGDLIAYDYSQPPSSPSAEAHHLALTEVHLGKDLEPGMSQEINMSRLDCL